MSKLEVKNFTWSLIRVCLIILIGLYALIAHLKLRQSEMVVVAKHEGMNLVLEIERFRTSHDVYPDEKDAVKQFPSFTEQWTYQRTAEGYEITHQVDNLLFGKSYTIVYTHNSNSQMQGWRLYEENGEWQ